MYLDKNLFMTGTTKTVRSWSPAALLVGECCMLTFELRRSMESTYCRYGGITIGSSVVPLACESVPACTGGGEGLKLEILQTMRLCPGSSFVRDGRASKMLLGWRISR